MNDIEIVLENIRKNSVLLSAQHKKRYLYLKHILQYFRLPIIVISGITSVCSVGLQTYMDQSTISAVTCLLGLSCGIIGSVELFLGIQSQMENELLMSKDFYLLSIDIYKILSLESGNRNIDLRAYLDERFSMYSKLFENCNMIDKRIMDNLTPIESSLASLASSSLTAGSFGV